MSSSESEFQSSFNSLTSNESGLEVPEVVQNSEATNSEYFFHFDEALEPLASESEWQEYSEAITREKEEEEEFKKRLSGETELQLWCKCSKCSVELLSKYEECMCCQEIDRVREKMESVEMIDSCITNHPGFKNVCLDRWVLNIASIGLKTKKNKSYQVVYNQGGKSEAEFLRAVSYRQVIRLIFDYMGKSNRTPLPACVYHAIRTEFPSETGVYQGFESEEDEGDDDGQVEISIGETETS